MSNNNEMWFEKYRPTTLEDYVCDDRTKLIINNFQRTQTHLLLHGNAGSGKTSLCKIFCNTIGEKHDVLWINASEQNSVSDVRYTIQSFVGKVSWSGKKKIVVLDEFDYMSKDSQAILRGILEKNTKRVLFLLTCNYMDRVIEPIKSRCFTRKLKTPNIYLVKDRCKYILDAEGISYTESDLNLLINVCFPDFRKCINILQNHSIDGELVPVDVDDYESDRLTLLQVVSKYLVRIEYNLNLLHNLSPKEQTHLQELVTDNEFLVDNFTMANGKVVSV